MTRKCQEGVTVRSQGQAGQATPPGHQQEGVKRVSRVVQRVACLMRVTVSGRCQDALNDPQPTDLSILSVSVVDLLTAACGKAAILHRRRLEPMHVVSPAAIRPSALAIDGRFCHPPRRPGPPVRCRWQHSRSAPLGLGVRWSCASDGSRCTHTRPPVLIFLGMW